MPPSQLSRISTTFRFSALPVIESILLAVLSLWPWIMYGLRGPNSDAVLWLHTNLAMYGMVDIGWNDLLFTQGPTLFLAPLLWVIRNHWFFWISSFLLAVSSVVITMWFWRLGGHLYRNRGIATAAAFVISVHPFLHQLHYWWMKEFFYISFLVAGLFSFNRYCVANQRQYIVFAASLFFMSLLMRYQGVVGLYLAVGCCLFRMVCRKTAGLTDKRSWIDLGLLVAIPLAMSLPFRALNYVRYGTPMLNQATGANVGWYTATEGQYSPANGPASFRLQKWSELILREPEKHRVRPPHVDESYPDPVRVADRIVNEKTFRYGWPKNIFWEFSHDWLKSDKFISDLTIEAIRSNPTKFLKWGIRQSRYYMTGLSENPTEFQADFAPTIIKKPGVVFDRVLLRSGVIEGWAIGGLAWRLPKIYSAYNSFRHGYSKVITYVKKVNFVLLPFLLGAVWLKRRDIRYFLLLSILVHTSTGIALGFMVGFHHRYGIALEIFYILYTFLWIDLAMPWVKNIARRRSQFASLRLESATSCSLVP
jgi:hypothetical protein